MLARRVDTGMIHINDGTIHDEPVVGFGGVKHSGLGRLNGEIIQRARFALELALPTPRGDAARLEVAAVTFAAVLLYQENLCR